MWYGILDLSLFGYIIATLILTQITIAAVTLYLHRHQAHRAMELHPIVSHFFRLWLWLTTGMVTREWVAIHRKHHANTEREGDPHSPKVYGIHKVLWEGAELYRDEAKNIETIERFSQGTPNDWMERNVYLPHTVWGVVLMLLIDVVLFGIPGITIWAIQMMWIPFWAAGVVNGLGHFWGYRNSECPDASTNLWPMGVVIGGEELHNNHHAYPNSAKFSIKPWEFDLGWFYIKTLEVFKLASVNSQVPKVQHVTDKPIVDTESLKAIFASRFQVLSHYGRDVMLPVFKQEMRRTGVKTRKTIAKLKQSLIRNEFLVNAEDKKQLEALLQENDALQVVYQYRQKLQAIWQKTTANQRELVDALQEWCKQAEETGIEVLRDFSHRLKGYTLNPNFA